MQLLSECPSRRRQAPSARFRALIVMIGMAGQIAVQSPSDGATASLATPTSATASGIDCDLPPARWSVAPTTVHRHSATITWTTLTTAPGVRLRLYEGCRDSVELLTEIAPGIGPSSYSYVDSEARPLATCYQLRTVLTDGTEHVLGVLIRLPPGAGPLPTFSNSVSPLDVADLGQRNQRRIQESPALRLGGAMSADHFRPKPELPPPRTPIRCAVPNSDRHLRRAVAG